MSTTSALQQYRTIRDDNTAVSLGSYDDDDGDDNDDKLQHA